MAYWNTVITPKDKLLAIDWREVWRYRDMFALFVQRSFQTAYKQTVLGPLWFFITPVLSVIVYIAVFGGIANIPTDGVPPMLFYLLGISLWSYFASCLTATSNSFVANAGIFGKVYFPRIIMPLVAVTVQFLYFCIQLLIFIAFYIYYAWPNIKQFFCSSSSLAASSSDLVATSSSLAASSSDLVASSSSLAATSSDLVASSSSLAASSSDLVASSINLTIHWHVLLFPVLMLLLALMAVGVGMMISSLTTKYHDIQIIFDKVISLWVYITPVIYPLSFVTNDNLHLAMSLNPVTPVIEAVKYSLLGAGEFSWLWLGYSALMTTIFCLIGLVLFNKVQKSFMDTV